MQNNNNGSAPSPYAGYSLRRGQQQQKNFAAPHQQTAGAPNMMMPGAMVMPGHQNPMMPAAFNSDWGGMNPMMNMMNPFMAAQRQQPAQQVAAAPAPMVTPASGPNAPVMNTSSVPNMMANYVKSFVQQNTPAAPVADFYKGAPLRRGQQQKMQAADPLQMQVQLNRNKLHVDPSIPVTSSSKASEQQSTSSAATQLKASSAPIPTALETTTSTTSNITNAQKQTSLKVPKAYDMWGSLDNTPLWKQVSAPGINSSPATLPAAAPQAIGGSSPTIDPAASLSVDSMWKTSGSAHHTPALAPSPSTLLPTHSTSLTASALSAFRAANPLRAAVQASKQQQALEQFEDDCMERNSADGSTGGSDDMAWLDEIKTTVYAAMKEEDCDAKDQVTTAFTMEWARHTNTEAAY